MLPPFRRTRRTVVALAALLVGLSQSSDAQSRGPTDSAVVRITSAYGSIVGRVYRRTAVDLAIVVPSVSVPTSGLAPYSLGADVPGDSVVLIVPLAHVWQVEQAIARQRVWLPRMATGAMSLALVVGGVLAASGRSDGATASVLGAAATGALLGASEPDRRFAWRRINWPATPAARTVDAEPAAPPR